MIKEFAEKMNDFTAKDARDYIRRNYPNDNVNETTINAQVIACSVNHPSAHHYPDSQRFLFYLGNARYRLYHLETDGIWERTPQGPRKTSDALHSGGNYFSQIRAGGEIFLPKAVQEKLKVGENDFIAFTEDESGGILLRKAELRIANK